MSLDIIADSLGEAEEKGKESLKFEGIEDWFPVRVDISPNS